MWTKKISMWQMGIVAGALALALTFGCGSAEPPAPIVREVVKEVPVEKIVTKEVVKEVPVEKIVVKEVVKEVIKEVIKEVPAASGPITPTGTIVVAVQSVSSPSGWPTQCPACSWLPKVSVQETLLKADKNDTGAFVFYPGLAESWALSEDITHTDFKLREGVQFHQGFGEFTAEDMAYSFNAGNPTFTPEAVHDTLPDPSIGRVDAVEKYVVRMNWTPFGLRGHMRASDAEEGIGAFSKKAFDENGGEWVRDNVIGTGPFEMVEWVAQRHIVAKARPDIENIWDKVPFVENLRVLEVPEVFTRRAMLETNEAQIAAVELKDWPDLLEAGYRKAPHLQFEQANILWQGTYWETNQPVSGDPLQRDLDLEKPWICEMDDADCNEKATKFRRAFLWVVDREGIVEELMGGQGRVAHVPQGTPDDPIVQKYGSRWVYPYDPEGARALLDEIKGFKGYDREKGITLNWWTGPSGVNAEMAEAIAAVWREELNANVEFDRQAYSTYRPNLVNRTATGVWFRNCCSSAPLTWDIEQWHSALTAPGGYNAGMEVPIASRTALTKNENVTNPEELERLTLAWLDFLYDNAFSTGIAVKPQGALYNPNAIASWTMRARWVPGPSDDAEWMLPVYR